MPATSSVFIRGLLCGCMLMGSTTGCADAAPAGNFASQFGAAKPSSQLKFDFEDAEPGKTPADFTTDLTGDGGPVAWVVQEDDNAPGGKRVLAQTSADSTD